MKTQILIFSILVLSLVFVSCENGLNVQPNKNDIIPDKFKVNIPNAISKSSSFKSTSVDTLSSSEIYGGIPYFIAIGEAASDVVQSIIWHIAVFEIADITHMTYTGEDDHLKELNVEANIGFEGTTWEYMLAINDVNSEGNDDYGMAMQVFWNTDPVNGIAILKPYNLNRNDRNIDKNTMYRVDYSEIGTNNYNETMTVYITGLPENESHDFWVDNMKMFVGKKGDIVDVFGNSNHPDAHFFTDDSGFNWAFVASSNEPKDIAVVELGLPKSNLDEGSREVLLEEYSVKNVLTGEINTWFTDKFGFTPPTDVMDTYLQNTAAPGYFNTTGFVQGGTSPGDEYDELETQINALAPYNPKDISNLTLDFK